MTTVLITGVTDGIGRVLAQHYAAAGAHVVGVGRRPVDAAPPGLFPLLRTARSTWPSPAQPAP